MACEVGLYYVLHITKQRNKNALLRLLPGLGECGRCCGPRPTPWGRLGHCRLWLLEVILYETERSSASCFQTPSALGTVWGSPSRRAGRAPSVILAARVRSLCSDVGEGPCAQAAGLCWPRPLWGVEASP